MAKEPWADKLDLPEWAAPDMGLLKRLIEGPTDAEIERALFGISSMKGTIWLDAGEIQWDPSRQGPYQEVLAEVEANPDDYDVSDPLIVDLQKDGSFVLNDGHHRFVKGQEEGVRSYEVEVQMSPGYAMALLEKLISKITRKGPGRR
jgi:hypothetical protein